MYAAKGDLKNRKGSEAGNGSNLAEDFAESRCRTVGRSAKGIRKWCSVG